MKKRFFAALLSFIMVFSLLPMNVMAVDTSDVLEDYGVEEQEADNDATPLPQAGNRNVVIKVDQNWANDGTSAGAVNKMKVRLIDSNTRALQLKNLPANGEFTFNKNVVSVDEIVAELKKNDCVPNGYTFVGAFFYWKGSPNEKEDFSDPYMAYVGEIKNYGEPAKSNSYDSHLGFTVTKGNTDGNKGNNWNDGTGYYSYNPTGTLRLVYERIRPSSDEINNVWAKVICNVKESHNGTAVSKSYYDLLDFTLGKEINHQRTLTVSAKPYVDDFNKEYPGHTLKDTTSKSIQMVYSEEAGAWVPVAGTTMPITFEVECDAPAPVTVDLETYIKKSLDTHGSTLPAGADTFNVTVTSNATGDTIPGSVSMGRETTKTFDFNSANILTFTETGTYTYTVQEVVPADADKVPGMTYDSKAYTLTIEVTKNNSNELKASVNEITITNSYTKPAVTGVTKTVVETKSNNDPAGISYPVDGKLTISADTTSVILLYKITVTGEKGAQFNVTDDGAVFLNGPVGLTNSTDEDGVLTVSGTLDTSEECEFYVTKTFDVTSVTTGDKLTNTATDTGGERGNSEVEVEKTYKLTYDANSGYFGEAPITTKEETLPQTGDHALNYTSEFTPTHDRQNDTNVLFLGWSTQQREILSRGDAESADTIAASIIASVNIPDVSTVYAVWALDDNNNGIPDVFEATATYEIVNGKWDDGTSDPKAEIVKVKSLNPETRLWEDANDPLKAVPDTADVIPNTDYQKDGNWTPSTPVKDTTVITADTTYTYTLSKPGTITFARLSELIQKHLDVQGSFTGADFEVKVSQNTAECNSAIASEPASATLTGTVHFDAADANTTKSFGDWALDDGTSSGDFTVEGNKLVFNKEGTFYFTVSEAYPADEATWGNMTYDKTAYTLKIEVTKSGNVLTATATVVGTTADGKIVFQNSYENLVPGEVSLDGIVSKQYVSVNGGSDTDEFVFKATVYKIDKENNNARTKIHELSNFVKVSTGNTVPVNFTTTVELKPGQYVITIEEVNGSRSNVNYNVTNNSYSYEIVVDPTGMVEFTPGQGEKTFVNQYTGYPYIPIPTPTPSKPALNTDDHYAYIMGYPDGTVQPNGYITRAEAATIFFRLLTDETREQYWSTTNTYSDIKSGDWYNNAVSTLSNAGIVSGYPDGTFRPNAPITRAEMSKIIALFAKLDKTTDRFTDIAGHWAEAYIKLAAGNGWIEGYPDGSFRPNQSITRAETVTMINRVLERVPSEESHLLPYSVMLTFPDSMPGQWFYIAIQEATNSHTYERAVTEKNGDEQWTALRDNRDWTLLEK